MDKSILEGTKWFNEAREEESPQAVVQRLEHCLDYKLLEDVQSIEGMYSLAPLLQRTSGLAVMERQGGCPLAFIKWERSGDSYVIYRHDANLPVGVLYAAKKMLPLNFEGLFICYYLCMEDFKRIFGEYSGAYNAFQLEAQQFDTYLPEQLRRQFSLIYHDSCITQVFYEICNWHQTHWSQMNREQQTETLRYGEALSGLIGRMSGW